MRARSEGQESRQSTEQRDADGANYDHVHEMLLKRPNFSSGQIRIESRRSVVRSNDAASICRVERESDGARRRSAWREGTHFGIVAERVDLVTWRGKALRLFFRDYSRGRALHVGADDDIAMKNAAGVDMMVDRRTGLRGVCRQNLRGCANDAEKPSASRHGAGSEPDRNDLQEKQKYRSQGYGRSFSARNSVSHDFQSELPCIASDDDRIGRRKGQATRAHRRAACCRISCAMRCGDRSAERSPLEFEAGARPRFDRAGRRDGRGARA